MNKILIFAFSFFVIQTSCGQTTTKKETAKNDVDRYEENNYRLFPTQNTWTFIKLDTRNGKMWQVQFDVSGSNRGEVILNEIPLSDKEIKGRFILHSTQNIYNFILLDQIDGKVYQVQWSIDKENRGVIPIN